MPIVNIVQCEILQVDDRLRLRKFDEDFTVALPWYQDVETVKLVDGKKEIYDIDKLKRMYHYLDRMSELYWIEIMDQDGEFLRIGDVTFWKEDMPIVIGNQSYRNQGIIRTTLALKDFLKV